MKSISKAYAALGELVMDRAFMAQAGVSFDSICKMLQVSPVDMGEVVFRELGMTGEELVGVMRAGA